MTTHSAQHTLLQLFALLWLSGSVMAGCQPAPAAAPAAPARDEKASSLEADVAHLKDITPSQSHTMIDVGYHMSNLWFAAQHRNWDLAAFEVDGRLVWDPVLVASLARELRTRLRRA